MAPTEAESRLMQKVAGRKLQPNPPLVDLINSENLGPIFTELEQAVNLLNQHTSGQQIQQNERPVVLNYANDLAATMRKYNITQFPIPTEIINQANLEQFPHRTLARFMGVVVKTSSYQFLHQFEPQPALWGEAIAVCGKLLLELHSQLRAEKVFGASALEEMIAVMRFNGSHPTMFEVIRPWFIEEEEETPGVSRGFSHSLVSKVKEFQDSKQ